MRIEPAFVLDVHMDRAISCDIFQDSLLYKFSSYTIVVDITDAQKGGVHHREKHLACCEAFKSLFEIF